jgi:hypothetical protein
MVLATLSLIFALVMPSLGTPDRCPDVHVIGVRGSGQVAYGSQVEGVVDAVRDGAATMGLDTAAEAIEYPSISVTESLGLVLINGEYDRSVAAGVDALRSAMRRVADRCPRTGLALVGYSQGAQVIKSALDGSTPGLHIAAVVLLADPTRDAAQAGITRLGDPSVAADGAFGAIALSDHLRAVAVDVCAAGDGVCERGRRSLVAHTEGYADAGPLVVPFVLAELSDRLPTVVGPR